MIANLPHLGPRDAAYYRRLGDEFAGAAASAASANDARQLMLAARDAWARAAELGDAGVNESALDAFLEHLAGNDA